MALNLDTAVRIVGKVSGLNEFKDLADRLSNVEQKTQSSKTGFEQLNAESQRLTQTTTQTLSGIRNQSQALQQLQTATRSSTAEMRQQSAESRTLGSVFQQLRGQSAGLLDGVAVSATKAAGAVKEYRQAISPTDEEIAKVRLEVLELGSSSKQTERSLLQQVQVLKNLRSQAEINGTTYRQLTRDIERLTNASKGLTAASSATGSTLSRQAAAALASRPLALPAAGQTSFQGTVNAQGFGGGARRLSNFEVAGTRDMVGEVMGSRTAQAMQATTQATTQARGKLAELFITIDKVTASSNGSISSLQRQRAAWEALRNAVSPAAPAYEKARANVQRLDEQLQKLTITQEKARRGPGVGREAFGSALGSLAAGGGVQGAVGALAGGLAFSGTAAGLAAAGGISIVGGVGALAARVGVEAETAQVRLKALTDQFGEYNQAQAAAARISETLRISTTEAQDGFSKLYGALRPTGVTLQEIEDAFVGFTAAARASGATAVESSAALQQLKQALGSGVLQGDELRSIREQAPAVGQAIAREMGVTIGELKKLGSEGQITTDIVLRALAKLKGEKLDQLNDQFKTSAQTIADLRIATEDFGRTVAKVFGPTAVSLLRGFTEAIRRLNDATVAFRDPSASTAAEILRSGRAPNTAMGQNVFLRGAQQLFIGTSGAGGVGLTGLEAEARDLARTRRQPYDRVLFELMQNRLDRLDGASGGNASQQAARDAAAGERQAARDRAAAAAAEAAEKEAKKRQKELEKLQREQEKELKAQLDFQNDLFDIRLNFEKRLADFREQSLDRAKQMERDIGDQRLQLERDQADIRRRTLDLYEDDALEQRRFQLQSAGLDTSAIDLQQRLNDISRKATEDAIRNQESATDRRLALERQIEDYKMNVAKGIRDITVNAGEQYADRVREGVQVGSQMSGGAGSSAGTARQRALLDTIAYAEGTSGARGYQTMFTGRTFSSFASHPRMIQRGGRYASDAAGRYQFLSTTWDGVARSLGLRDFSPANQDIGALELIRRRGVNSDAPLNLRSLAALAPEWASLPTLSGRSYYGQPVKGASDLLRYYNQRLALYGQGVPSAPTLPPPQRTLQAALQPATPLQPMNAASLQVPGVEGLGKAAADYQEAIDGTRAAGDVNAQTQMVVAYRKELGGITRELDSQLLSVQQQSIIYDRTLQLQRSGLSPELAQQTAEREQTAKIETASLILLRDQLKTKIEEKGLNDKTKQGLTQILQTTESTLAAQQGKLDLMQQEAQQLEEVKQRYEQYRALIDGTANAISGGLGSAFDLLIDGTENWGNSLRGIASGVLRDIAKQLVQIYAVQPATKGLQGLLGSLLGGGGSAGAAAAAGAGASVFTAPLLSGVPAITGAFAKGGIMTDRGPLPLRAYANGGIATGPQLALFGEGRMNEAYVPLPDGRRIPVAMQGGGGSNVVNVTVNAEGSAVQGDSSRSEQLGQVVARAIQEEMIRQRRPGGLLAS
jgi:tape measure domain-containing protein